MTTYQIGLFSEWWARMYLRMHGFRIVANRMRTGRNTNRAEIDIIARRGNLLLFIEVKAHKTTESAWNAISPHQISRLRSAAENYIARTRWHGDARFDVILVHRFHVQWIQGAI